MKIVLRILAALLIGAYLVLVLGFAGKQYEGVLCRGMEIVILDSLERGLIHAGDIENMVRLDHPEVAGMPISDINMGGIEENLVNLPAISSAQVYADVRGHLIIEVTQRIPLARVEDRDHRKYYLDAQGYIIPAEMDYAPHVLHINGHIPGKYGKQSRIMPEKGGDGQGGLMEDLLKMVRFIQADPFWSSQIEQLYVNQKGEFELVPRVGAQIILFGGADRMETKFFKLETLYREGFSHTGWNNYEIINLKYNNQVICTKR